MKNKHLLVAHHKIKQLVTPLYDKWLRRKASSASYRIKYWAALEKYLTTKKYEVVHVCNVNMCNAKCVFCGQHKFERPKATMSYETFVAIINDCVELGTFKEVDFTPTLGDPLLDSNFEDKIFYAINKGLRVSLTTNGILLDASNIMMLSACSDIRISLGGLDREEYKSIYGVDKFDIVYGNIINFLVFLQRINVKSPRIKILFRASSSPKQLTKTAYWYELQHYINEGYLSVEFTNYYDNWGGAIKPTDLLGHMKMRGEKKKLGIPCFSLDTFFVETKGNVRMCGCRFINTEEDGLVVGNIHKTPLRVILSYNNLVKLFLKFYNKQKDESPEVCQKCTLYRPMMFK